MKKIPIGIEAFLWSK